MVPAQELKLLVVAILIGVVHLLWGSIAAQPQRGLKWNVPRDEPLVLTGMAGRLERAFANYRETFPLFAAAVIIGYLAGRLGPVTYYGSLAYVVARAAYIPLYAFGVPYVRSFVWLISFLGILAVLAALVL